MSRTSFQPGAVKTTNPKNQSETRPAEVIQEVGLKAIQEHDHCILEANRINKI